jgi:NAD(P)-dependent dehydrogenase (short-subunit alcohol dehydrogenase family)
VAHTKHVIVTGGASGIAEATCELLSESGTECYILDLQAPKKQIKNCRYFDCDVSDYQAVAKAIEDIKSITHQIDGLFCCAGKLESNRFENSSIENINQVIQTNLLGTIYVLKAVLPLMQKNKQGTIVLTGSDQSFNGRYHNTVYGCTKAAIAQLTKSLAIENAEHNIRVNCVCPGSIDTPFLQDACSSYAKRHELSIDTVIQEMNNEQPIKRLGTPKEVAELVEFLLSDKAGFMTGSVIPIDGGYTAQ